VPDLLSTVAPEPVALWGAAVTRLPLDVPPDRLHTLAGIVRDCLGAPADDVPVPATAVGAAADGWVPFAQQFVVDVARIGADQRATAMTALGADAFTTVQALYVLDLGTRANAAFRQLFAERLPTAPAADDLWPTLESFMRAVARLDALDPTTTELVRLRGARSHRCRLCQSIRNVHAVRAGADEPFLDQVDDFAASALSDRHKAALRLVDAVVWTPASWPAGLADDLHASFTDAELVELVLDIVRNAANKIAVAFGADDPHVTDGLEYFATDAAGDLVYGLEV
jgi:alkylhydroperoxidase family enzyme